MGKPGRKPFEPTKEQNAEVLTMALSGTPEDEIARVIGIAPKTLRKHFRETLDTAHTRANARVAGSLYSAAIAGNVTAQIFWCKTRLGWREKQDVELSGNVGITLDGLFAGILKARAPKESKPDDAEPDPDDE